jgi:3-mercaptopyruvate sulfurtransferase SseA
VRGCRKSAQESTGTLRGMDGGRRAAERFSTTQAPARSVKSGHIDGADVIANQLNEEDAMCDDMCDKPSASRRDLLLVPLLAAMPAAL